MTKRPANTMGSIAAVAAFVAALATVPAEVAYGQPPTTRRVVDVARRNPVAPDTPCAAALPCTDDASGCQPLSPASPYPIWGVDSAAGCGRGEVGWDACGLIPWEQFAQGEYVGHARTPHVPEYRIREQDRLAVYFRRTREEISRPYEIQVGDIIYVESFTAQAGSAGPRPDRVGNPDIEFPDLPAGAIDREVAVEPDGTITLPLLGQVRATRRTIPQLRDELEELYEKYYREPSITVTPIKMNSKLLDLLDTVDSRYGERGGLSLPAVVTPSGHVQLPAVGSVFVQGLTLEEAKKEIDARYNVTVPGVEVSLDLTQRAGRFVYVVGEVGQPGRYELVAPTSAMQAIALAGGWEIGANLRQVVVFRRGPDWRLMATMVDLRGALYARRPVPADDIWLNDSDIVLVPKTPVQVADEIIEQVFTRGLYSVVPSDVIWNVNDSSNL